MTEDEFWQLIERSLDGSEGNPDEQVQLLSTELHALPAEEIISFDRHFETFRRVSFSRDLWGAAYIVAGGCSDDSFEYFRWWLISRGRSWFERVQNNPDDLADYPAQLTDESIEFEDIAYVAARVYEEKFGPEFPYAEREPYTLTGESWEDDEETFRRRWPKLFAKYW